MRTFCFFSFCFFYVMAFGSLQTGKHDEAWMVLKHIHDTNMRARGEPERVFTVSTRLLTASIPPSPQSGDRSVSPPAGQQDQDPQAAGRAGGDAEWVSQPCAQGAVQDQGWAQRGAFLVLLLWEALPHFTETLTACFILTDLGNIHEMLQLPSEGQHSKAGCCLVHTLFWVGRFFFLKEHLHFSATHILSAHYHPRLLSHWMAPRWVITLAQLNISLSEAVMRGRCF